MEANQPWINVYSIVIPNAQHQVPKHLEKRLPKFDPDNDVLPEDHINKFMISLRLMNVEHEDFVCRLFLYAFQGKASTWFFNLALRSITSWKQFETTFMTQFGDDKTSRILFLQISRIKINNKQKVKDFNQIFITLLNRILDKLVELVQIEFYTSTLPPPIAMFVKGKKKQTLAENFQEAIKVEKDLEYISIHLRN